MLSKSGILGGGSDFWTYTIDVRRYEPLAARHTLALFSLASLRTGRVGEDIPVYLQFNLGGTNTVRGWTLGAREGKNQFINTLEYRYELTLIAKSSKHENAKQPHWAQARSSCWGTRSPPL